MEDLLPNWPQHFPGCAPIAHRLKAVFSDRWVRFHGLPEAKRYPEVEAEYGELLRRHNAVLGALAGVESPVALLTTKFSRDAQPQGKPWRTVAMHEEDGDFADPCYWHVSAEVRAWRPGAFNSLVRSVADGEASNVMLVAPDCRWLLHPYDGGMDVILATAAEWDHLKSAFAAWQSPYPSGL